MRMEQNASIWSRPDSVRSYAAAEGFLDPGERALYARVCASARGAPVLDLGVGAGRTVPLLAPLASEYRALDYVPEMVAACRRRYPDIDVQLGDARDLSRFASDHFGLVNFSFNGIDALGHEDRQRVLCEVQRVLRPGGLFWFSTLNMAGMGRRMRPWAPEWPARETSWPRYVLQSARMLGRIPRRCWNRARLKPQFRRGDGWCMDTLSAHDYALLMHYTSLGAALRELADAGFAPVPTVLESSFGRPVSERDDTRDVFWFQILAQKPMQI